MISIIDRALGRLNTWIGYTVAISLGLFALAIPLDLLIRRVGLGNMPWLYELVEYVLYIGVFLGTPWVLREGAHVRVDLVISSLPRRLAIRLEQFLDGAGAVVSAILLYYGCVATIEAYVGGNAWQARLREVVPEDSQVLSLAGGERNSVRPEHLVSAAREGDQPAQGRSD